MKPKIKIQEFHGPVEDYFDQRIRLEADLPALKVRYRKCPDCPANGMYYVYVEMLRKKSPNIIKTYSEKWFCHCAPNLACKGNWDLQGLTR